MTNILLLPAIVVTATSSQDGDCILSVGFQNTGSAIDLTGIDFALNWRPVDALGKADPFNVPLAASTTGLYLTNGETTGVVTLSVPQSKTGSLPAGSYTADLVATGDGYTIVVGNFTFKHGAIGAALITSLVATARNAVTANSVGYVPGPTGPRGLPGEDGTDGNDGSSAYQIAVANGFSGSQSAWLASLVGPGGSVEDLSDSFTGDIATTPGSTVATIQPNVVTNAKAAKMAALTIKSNVTGSLATANDNSLTAIIDAAIGSTRGAILTRTATGWNLLPPGSAGSVVTSSGSGADLVFAASGSAPPRSDVRQTVQCGPASGSAPSFLPATSSSNAITTQNVSTGSSALAISAAQGFGGNGQIDYIWQFTTNQTWSGLLLAQTVSSVSTTTTVATFTTAAAHGLIVGSLVTVSGSSLAALNGTFVVATVPSSTSFTVNGPNPTTGVAFTAGSPTGASYTVTNFLAVDASAGTTSSYLLEAIYQFGGAPSVTSGQFTFDIQAMIGYLGNGTAAVPTPLVFVGRAMMNTAGAASTIAYAYNGYYDSGHAGVLPNSTALFTFTHNLGTPDPIVTITFKNLAAEFGYQVGQVMTQLSMNNSTPTPVPTLSTRLTTTFPSGPSASASFFGVNFSNGSTASFTDTSWAPRGRIRRGWGGA